jgi:hypothetical protein
MTVGHEGVPNATGLGGGQQAAPSAYPDHV